MQEGTPIDGVGLWACLAHEFTEGKANTLSSGNGRFEIGVTGDIGDIEVFKSVARALLAKLPD